MNRFKLNIRYLRKKEGMTQGEFAKEINVKRNSISNWEQGTSSPNLDVIIQIGKYFSVTLDDLLTVNIELIETGITKEVIQTRTLESSIPVTLESSIPNTLDPNIAAMIESNSKISESIEKLIKTVVKREQKEE